MINSCCLANSNSLLLPIFHGNCHDLPKTAMVRRRGKEETVFRQCGRNESVFTPCGHEKGVRFCTVNQKRTKFVFELQKFRFRR